MPGRNRSIRGRLAHAGAFTLGVVIAERVFRSPDGDRARSPWAVRVGREEVLAMEGELGRANDARMRAITARLARALVSGPPRVWPRRRSGTRSGQPA
jgi:hypothetical protein